MVLSSFSRSYSLLYYFSTFNANIAILEQGQEVEFAVKKTKKGLSATKVVAGSKQRSPYFIFGLVSLLLTVALFAFLYLYQHLNPIVSYLIAINITTFLLYGYDKLISAGEAVRVPEWNLHALAILGGSPAGLSAQKFFHHKTIKGSFQLVYWLIVALQVGLLLWIKP
jgi:uncharacterized membrane protein YsdA (DUF1294 family)